MKTTPLVLLLAGLLAGDGRGLAGTPYRTDVNPALVYWQLLAILPKDDQKNIDSYQTAPLDEKYRTLVASYDTHFRYVRRAVQLKEHCNWGIDSADGPETMLPHLGLAKKVAKVAACRARYFLSHGQEDEAVQDLLGAFVLARRVGDDQTLISALVQIAMESIVTGSIAENFYAFSPDALQRLMAGIDASPTGSTISRCIGEGERSFVPYFRRKIEEAQAAHPGNEGEVLSEIRELFAKILTEGEHSEKSYETADLFIRSAGNTSAGLLAWIQALDPLYDEMQKIAALPYDRFGPMNQAFFENKISNSTNLFAREFFPALEKGRAREFRGQARLALLRAGIQYRLNGETGLKTVADPFGSGPFGFRRFVFQNVDRGFELRSQYAEDYAEVLIFAEKAGAPFVVSGPRAGKPIENTP